MANVRLAEPRVVVYYSSGSEGDITDVQFWHTTSTNARTVDQLKTDLRDQAATPLKVFGLLVRVPAPGTVQVQPPPATASDWVNSRTFPLGVLPGGRLEVRVERPAGMPAAAVV